MKTNQKPVDAPHARSRTRPLGRTGIVTEPTPVAEPSGPTIGHSDELGASVNRIRHEETQRIEKAEQKRLAELREKARLD